MNSVSLFSGIGGFDYALENNGIPVVATCENDKKAQEVLKIHFPKAKHFSDIKTLTGEDLFNAGFKPNGIITGGFPCQDLSIAGKRQGLSKPNGEPTRSGLFWEFARILEETKAQNFILENVPGLLSSNQGRDFGIILTHLVGELGFGVGWRIFDSQFFQLPQRRKRVFIAGTLGNNWRTPAQVLDFKETSNWNFEQSKQKRQQTT